MSKGKGNGKNHGRPWVNWYFISTKKERSAEVIEYGDTPQAAAARRKTAELRAKVQAARDARLEAQGIITVS